MFTTIVAFIDARYHTDFGPVYVATFIIDLVGMIKIFIN